jgi:hypothetical protein
LAFFRARHTGSARHGAGLFDPDLCNIGSHHVASDVRTHLRRDAGVVMTLSRAGMPVKMAVVMVMAKDFRRSRVGSSKKAEDYQPSLLHGS